MARTGARGISLRQPLGELGGPGDSCDEHVPPPIVVEVAKARKLVELTLSDADGIYKAGDTIAFWQAPSTDGQTCFILGLAGERPAADTSGDGEQGRPPRRLISTTLWRRAR